MKHKHKFSCMTSWRNASAVEKVF